MTLLVLSFPADGDGVRNGTAALDALFAQIAAKSVSVLPGDPLPKRRIATCLCFEGVRDDFAESVLPLLETHGLRALVAVAPGAVHNEFALARGRAAAARVRRSEAGGSCTWTRLQRIARHESVAIAAYGYSGCRLDLGAPDLETEVHVPRTLLSTRLECSVDTFVFPQGRSHRKALREIRSGYRFVIGGGNAANATWHQSPLYGIRIDALSYPEKLFAPSRLARWRLRGWYRRNAVFTFSA